MYLDQVRSAWKGLDGLEVWQKVWTGVRCGGGFRWRLESWGQSGPRVRTTTDGSVMQGSTHGLVARLDKTRQGQGLDVQWANGGMEFWGQD